MSNTDRLNTALADRYLIERQLGAGGMATVYLAADLKHDRKVALKVLRPELAAVLGGERFVQEIKTTAALQHPHILPLFDSGTADGFLYYVMPWIEGETLRDRLNRETQLAIDDAIRITRDVADALDYAHRHGVIHRDIKPENILLHDGRPMVADFGIALALSAAAGGRMTETGMSLGTPHYMSPEQATADKDITARSDVYSLGSVLYEMLTGEPPHMGNSAQAIIMKIVTEEAAPVTKLRKSVPPNVTAAVGKALEKLPADRFDSAKAFADALANADFSAVTTAAKSPTALPPYRLTAFRPLVAAVALLTLFAAWGWLRPSPPLPATERMQIVLDSRDPTGMPHPFWPVATAISPDGSAIVWADSGVNRPLMLKTLDVPEARPLEGTSGGNPFFSPDGEWIGFISERGLQKIALQGGVPILLSDSARTSPQVFSMPVWLDDGTILFSAPGNGRILRADADGGPTTTTRGDFSGSGAGIIRLQALPDSRGALVTTCPNAPCTGGVISIYDLRRDTVVPLVGASSAWFLPPSHILLGRADGYLFAQRIDLEAMAITGPSIPVLGPTATVAGTPAVAFSPAGVLLYGTGGGDAFSAALGEVVAVDREGRVGSSFPLEGGVGFVDFGIQYAPGGARVALVARDAAGTYVAVRTLPDGPTTRITFDGPSLRPVWAPDGRDVLYIGERGGRYVALRRPADGTGTETVIAAEERPIFEILMSPDGAWIVYRTDNTAAGRGDILARRTSGDTTVRVLLATPAEESSPALSPDGRFLAYGSDESGRFEVYVRPFPDVEGGRWQVSRDGGTEPLWSADGRELFYRDGAGTMMAASVETRTAFAVVTTRPLFPTAEYAFGGNHQAWAVATDGRSFLFARAAGGAGGARRLVLVRNLLTELGPALERN